MAPNVQVLDRFVTEYLFKTDTGALNRLDRRMDGLKRKLNMLSRQPLSSCSVKQ